MLPGLWFIASEASKLGHKNKPKNKQQAGRPVKLCGVIMFKNSGSHVFSFQEQGPHNCTIYFAEKQL